jgi:hypothetical protein
VTHGTRQDLLAIALKQEWIGRVIPQNYLTLQQKIEAIKDTGKQPFLDWASYVVRASFIASKLPDEQRTRGQNIASRAPLRAFAMQLYCALSVRCADAR